MIETRFTSFMFFFSSDIYCLNAVYQLDFLDTVR